MFRNSDDYLSALLTDGPPAARCELVRHLPSDDFGPRVQACLRDGDRPVVVRGIAIADAAWMKASKRLQALAGIRSEHAARLLAYGRHEGLAYFIHEHEGGPRLSTLLRERKGRLAMHELLPIFGQLLLAVSEAHQQGVVVGGVRPQDVRLLPDESGFHIFVRNLGLAVVLGVPAGRVGSTDHPSIYRAPEPDISKSPASDVFSLGVLFIRLMTGALPSFGSDDERQDLLRERLEQALVDDPAVNAELVTVLRDAIEPVKRERIQNATELLHALLQVMKADDLQLPFLPELDESSPIMTLDEGQVPKPRPDRERTMQQRWERPTPKNAKAGGTLRVSPVPPAHANTQPARMRLAHTLRVKPLSVLRRQPSTFRRVVMGMGLLSTAAAVALAIAVGEPGASPMPLPTASLVGAAPVVETAEADASQPEQAEPADHLVTVVVDSNVPGVLTIDGKPVGQTPARATVPAGRHVVRVEAKGHQTWRSRLDLEAGQEHRVAVALVPSAS